MYNIVMTSAECRVRVHGKWMQENYNTTFPDIELSATELV